MAGERGMCWGSDVVAEMLRRLDIPFICINPGSSIRGLHDSIVNYLGDDGPKLLLTLHEESAVAIAHGYAKATGRPLAVALHSNVGLMHGAMAIYNCWCDRMPMLILGATGAVDSAVRRSWIDWVHTWRDQGAMVRLFTKWDDQPASPSGAIDAVLRAHQMACMPPCGPSYVILDRTLQEEEITEAEIPDVERFTPPPRLVPSTTAVEPAAALLRAAENPVIMLGRVSRQSDDWAIRIRLAETLGARVITDLRSGAAFPTDHPLHGGPADLFLSPGDRRLVADADVVLSLDWPDIADALIQARELGSRNAKVIHCSIDHQVHGGGSMDHQRLPPVDIWLNIEPDAVLAPLLELLPRGERARSGQAAHEAPVHDTPTVDDISSEHRIPTLSDIGVCLSAIRAAHDVCLVRVPLNWPAGSYHFREPLDFLGYDGGGGVGSGPGMAVGAALALEGTERLPVSVMGDGEFLAAPTALWSAAHYRIPVLVVVANNRSYFTDEVQQELVARHRGRIVENKWIGQKIDDPPANLSGIARDLGVAAEGPIEDVSDLHSALLRGFEAVKHGRPYLIDVLIDPTLGANFDWLSDA